MQTGTPDHKDYNAEGAVRRILVADDHEIVRSALLLFIKNIIEDAEIDEALNGETALDKISVNEYALIILDVNMPSTDPFALVSRILEIWPEAKILMFSMYEDHVYAKRFLSLGAKGYINKTAPVNELATAIKNVIGNKMYISDSLKEKIAQDSLSDNMDNPFNTLSQREFEVVQLITRGESTKSISHTLGLKPSTVATFKQRILNKLNCKNTIEVIQLAKVYNVIPPS